MHLELSADQQEQLSRLATSTGRKPEALILDAVNNLLAFEGWFLDEVGKGQTAARAGEFVEHAEVGQLIASRYRCE